MSEHTLDRMVAGLMKTAAQKLEATPPEMSKVAHVRAPQISADDEAEKTAAALEYLADCLDDGQLTTDTTDLERIKQAYEIVETVEADPRLKFKIVTAMAEIPRNTGESPSISPGMGGSAMRHDLQSPPGGGKTQQRATANAPASFATPKSTNNTASTEHSAPGLMDNDLNKIPGGGGAYPERGPIRDAAVKSAFAMGRALRKSAEFSPNVSKGDGKPAKIKGKHGGGPLGKPDGVSQAGENVPGGASPRQVQSNQAAIGYTQRDAKRTFVQKEVGKVLDAPILQRSADDVLEKNLTHTEVSKLASLARKELVERSLRGSVQLSSKHAALTEEERRIALGSGVGGALAGGIGGAILGNRAAPDYAQKQAALDRGGYQEEDKPLDDSRLEREAAFRDSLQDAARAKGERMHGASAMSGMPNSGSATTPSIPGY